MNGALACNKNVTTEDEIFEDSVVSGAKSTKKKGYKKTNSNRVYFYKQNQLKYLELLVNSKFKVLDQIFINAVKKRYGSLLCFYKRNHNFETLNDICSYNHDFEDNLFGFDCFELY